MHTMMGFLTGDRNNNQPAGSFIRFRVWDANDSVRQSSFIQVQVAEYHHLHVDHKHGVYKIRSLNKCKGHLDLVFHKLSHLAHQLTSGTKTAFPTAMVSSTSANAYTGAIAGGVSNTTALASFFTSVKAFTGCGRGLATCNYYCCPDIFPSSAPI
ncbi:hypothetical protein AG1IA_05642 [Rhizoctonia solani AG-1 IA]|uniref:Uncharacterized protein n=1 Tax=Thanatephorus cucumeris (strain AG1-IA) TaxID=983506 RepID=L8WVG1_THACA|nr:hypothetical protein AG1IA_05642 [Rhizoctonia solani AG-1 IA]